MEVAAVALSFRAMFSSTVKMVILPPQMAIAG